MLGKLFGSRARIRILKLFLNNIDGRFYVRQISRDLDLQLNSVRRELENLTDFGLLKIDLEIREEENLDEININQKKKVKKGKGIKTSLRTKDGRLKKKYFMVNKNFVLFDEIKTLIMKSQAMYENDIIKKILNFSSPKIFILTGFFVNNPDSDVDMLLVGRINKTKILQVISDFEKEINREINFTILTEEEFIYRRDITDVFLYDILGGKNITVIDEIGSA
ncbi:helix-turn-helix transcriptional regulator [Candidatus Parcubacteria bacterium]|nr:helix-turn-helix transcriptional regulator [Candidatus Parcubacteria bacterium]